MIVLYMLTLINGVVTNATKYEDIAPCQAAVNKSIDNSYKLGGGKFINSKELEYKCEYKNEILILDIELAKQRKLLNP